MTVKRLQHDAETRNAVFRLARKYTKDDGSPNVYKIAKESGVSRSTITTWLAEGEGPADRIEFAPEILNPEHPEPIEELVDRCCKMFERKRELANNQKWFEIKINETKPYGILFIGDPHLGDDGCNIPLLKKHAEIARESGCIYSVNTGDVTNRWVGRLVRKYASQETSRTTEERLAEWFLSQFDFILWLLGNHDEWDGGSTLFRRMCKGVVPVIDWRAQFRITHPTGTEVRCDVAHGRKGHSQWNELHNTVKAAKMGQPAHIFTTSHTHNFAYEKLEIAETESISWLVQLRGYKFFDDYALHKGFPECDHGSSVLAIVDPTPGLPNPIIQCFDDVEKGAAYLRFLRDHQ